ncbi:MAG: polyphosphate polymerase domain-containing protein [Bacteroidetes bacterium]|jgi:hypothetical protein|nr:polyphosphate polymerase domain-containing protein [Bacteroidota bacterium]
MDKKALQDVLARFEPISLSEMDNVKLLDRIDVKYNIHEDQLLPVLQEVLQQYRTLDINGNRVAHYETTYLDTPEHLMYKQHHQGKVPRFKIRIRKYVDSNLAFFEIKKKSNKGRTLKSRIKLKSDDSIFNDATTTFLEKETHLHPEELTPALVVEYDRITLVNKTGQERLTIDTNLVVRDGNTAHQFTGLVIIEAKLDSRAQTPFRKALQQRRIKPFGMSKFVMAMSKLHNDIKINNFKQDLKTVDKIAHVS